MKLDVHGGECVLSLVTDYLSFPDEARSRKFKSLMQRLDMTIVLYEERQHNAIVAWLNPLF